MVRFDTAFLFKATTLVALCCLPIPLNQESGFVWTAFLMPPCLALLVAMQVPLRKPLAVQFLHLSESVVEFRTTGGLYEQWTTRCRLFAAGACLSFTTGFPALHTIDPEPPELWGPVSGLMAVVAAMLLGHSTRLFIDTHKRAIQIDNLVFNRFRWLRSRWQVEDDDFLAIAQTKARYGGPDFQFWEALYLCRPGQLRHVVGLCTGDRIPPDTEAAAQRIAQRIAQLLDIPFEGYRKVEELEGLQESIAAKRP